TGLEFSPVPVRAQAARDGLEDHSRPAFPQQPDVLLLLRNERVDLGRLLVQVVGDGALLVKGWKRCSQGAVAAGAEVLDSRLHCADCNLVPVVMGLHPIAEVPSRLIRVRPQAHKKACETCRIRLCEPNAFSNTGTG